MKVNLHASKKRHSTVLQDKTNITNNTNKAKTSAGKDKNSKKTRNQKSGLHAGRNSIENAENTARN